MNNGRSHFRTAPSAFGSGRHAVLLLAAGWLLTKGWQALSRARQTQVNAESAALPERLQTWEGEGGRSDSRNRPGRRARSPTPEARGGPPAKPGPLRPGGVPSNSA
jgi:hypothetical protein